nr:YlbE-like family protein [uncultured Bacillus sp.]
MRKDVYLYLKQQKELLDFLREQPVWYRKLTRDPNHLQNMEVEALHYYKKTIPHHVTKFSNGVQMASMMISMFQAMNSNNQ